MQILDKKWPGLKKIMIFLSPVPNKMLTKKFTKKFDSKVIIRQYFHRKTGL